MRGMAVGTVVFGISYNVLSVNAFTKARVK